jgi:ABC-type transport system substrate-binding protein
MSASIARRLLTAICAAGLAACGGGDGGGGGGGGGKAGDKGGTPVQGGTAAIDMMTDFQAFNPVTNTHLTTDDVVKHMLFTPLIQYDSALQPVPWLAERWELTDTSVTFFLRKDVTWHDGKPVTAEDVKFTFDMAKDPATASLLGTAYMNMVREATVVDPYTVRVTTTKGSTDSNAQGRHHPSGRAAAHPRPVPTMGVPAHHPGRLERVGQLDVPTRFFDVRPPPERRQLRAAGGEGAPMAPDARP